MVTIQPPLLGLQQASGTVYTQRGPVTVEWSQALDGDFSLSVTLPVNMHASIFVPVTGGQTVTARGAGAPIFVQAANGYAQYTAGSGDSELAAR
jgi:alpha-L-rhamnosidase